jgi:hypothetical protein
LSIVDNAPPGSTPGDISANAPTSPDQALQQMAHDRLAAAGSTGTAIFTIDQASILHQPGGTLTGEMDVHLDIVLPNGQHAGYAEAKVTRDYTPQDSSGDADSPAALYALTTQMMQDMNVELELQIRRSLGDWLVDAGGAPVAGAIQQQTLGAPGAPTPDAATPDAVAGTPADAATPATDTTPAAPPVQPPAPPAPPPAPAPPPTPPAPASSMPDAIFPTGIPGTESTPAAPPAAQQLSPQPGYLHVPGQTTPAIISAPDTTSGTTGQ